MKLNKNYSKSLFLFLLMSIFVILLCLIIFYNTKDITQKYNIYQSDDFIIVENKENPEAFCSKEWIYYYQYIKDAYLCTKEGKNPKKEKEAYLYIDLGEMGEWWADPFGNLQKDNVVKNKYIPDELINILKKYVHLDFGTSFISWIDEVKIKELTVDEVKKISFDVFNKVYDEEAVSQWYYQVDFDNDGILDIVVYSKWGMGRLGFTETYFFQQIANGQYNKTYQMNTTASITKFIQYNKNNYIMNLDMRDYEVSELEYDYYNCELYYFKEGYPQETVRITPEKGQLNVTVRKRFVNNFINISEGNR